MDDIHLNVAQVPGTTTRNAESDAFVPEPGAARQVMDLYRRRKGTARSPRQFLENAYLKRLDQFLQTGRTPMPCHALRASCFIDPWGVVYPCITYSRPIGRLRDTGMRLDPIWNDARTREVQREIWDGQCPQCWTACEAYQSILGNVAGRAPPDGRRCSDRWPDAVAVGRGAAMNVVCFTDGVTRSRLDHAAAHHLAADVSVVIAAKQEAPSIGGVIERTRRYANTIVVVDGHSTDGTANIAAAGGARVVVDGGRGKGDAIRRAIPLIRTPVTVFLDADGSHDPEDIPLLVAPILAGDADHVAASRLRGGSSELHGGFDEFFRLLGQLVHHRVHQLALRVPV